VSHLTKIPKEDPNQVVFRICARVHSALDKDFNDLEAAPERYRATVFGKAETTRVEHPSEIVPATEHYEAAVPISNIEISEPEKPIKKNTAGQPTFKKLILASIFCMILGIAAGILLL